MENDKLQQLRRYCDASAKFITDDDSEQDRFARMAYRDVISKIDELCESQKPTSEPDKALDLLGVVPCFSDADIEAAWYHGELRIPENFRHLNNFDNYFKAKYGRKPK